MTTSLAFLLLAAALLIAGCAHHPQHRPVTARPFVSFDRHAAAYRVYARDTEGRSYFRHEYVDDGVTYRPLVDTRRHYVASPIERPYGDNF